ncbi:hypothetical protein J6TS1_27770 [Siminovitchia terrae]|uniref:Uncharacterized protein n=1 Tax=Siminovitchia terrae TaxID=1914933 RepID=A0ABQ4L020_SIMTE|nr:conjugal transfer protein [Siminovitchia terrae]GIN90399.1 hypothetical protein J22TS1_14500 [Siminovitchia terrae]GIN96907.1 hypothetical protein J6TS1_27770 [Siminovitchia terrae]
MLHPGDITKIDKGLFVNSLHWNVNIEKNYIFSELINPIFQQSGDQIQVRLSVKYLDETTQTTQISQYVVTLEKDTNWIIVE